MSIIWGCVMVITLLIFLYRHRIYSGGLYIWHTILTTFGYGTPLVGVSYNQEQVLREASRLGIVVSARPVIGEHSYWPRYWQQFTPRVGE